MKLKKLTALITALLLTFSISACGFIPQFDENSAPQETDGSYSDSPSDGDAGDDTQTDGNSNGDSSTNSSGNSSDVNDGSDSSSDGSNDDSDNSGSSDSSSDNTEDDKPEINESHCLIVDQAYSLSKGETLGSGYTLTGEVIRIDTPYKSGYVMLTFIVWGREDYPIYCYKLQGENVSKVKVGDYITVFGTIKNYKGTVEFDKDCLLTDLISNGFTPDGSDDPYQDIDEEEFYQNYTPATSNEEAYYRTQRGLMSGSIQTPDQEPKLSSIQPKQNGKFIRNTQMQFSADKTTYTVVDYQGNPVMEIYRDGAYIDVEEVAAYVYAFGTYPANYTPSKNTDPDESIWGKYLRVNHSKFSGDTRSYPYEPVLPNITGCGGDLQYWEMDIGTTGTDCDPSYPIKIYNDGKTITRGAARIVYGKTDLNGNGVYEENEHHVFYTYNHYNDFQEYLNYFGGWGEKFGNITGGGTLSSKNHYNPTDYVPVAWGSFTNAQKALAAVYKHRFSNTALFAL